MLRTVPPRKCPCLTWHSPLWFARYCRKASSFILLHRLVPSRPVPAVPSPVNTCNYTWCHVFLLWFSSPKWATFQSLGADIHCALYVLPVSLAEYCSPKRGPLTHLTWISELSSLLTPTNRCKNAGQTSDERRWKKSWSWCREKGWNWNIVSWRIFALSIALSWTPTCARPWQCNYDKNGQGPALLEPTVRWAMRQADRPGFNIVHRCHNDGNQAAMGAFRKSTSPAWGRVGGAEQALQRKWCLNWDEKGTLNTKGWWKSVQGHIPRTEGAKMEALRHWEFRYVWSVRQEVWEVNKERQIRILLRILTWASRLLVAPCTEMRSTREVGSEEYGMTTTQVFNPPLTLARGGWFL